MSLPYIVGHPIKKPSDFYGFHELVALFYNIIGGENAHSVSLLGLKRSGKTSLLYHLAHSSVLAKYVANPDDYVTLYVDFSTCNTPTKFYRQVYQELIRRLGNISAQEHEHLRDLPGADDINWLLRQYPGRRVILLLDEFDRVIHGTFDQDFLSELRAIASASDNELAIVTASYDNLEHVGGKLGLTSTSPFYNIFYPKYLYLNGLDEVAARDLIRKPAEQEGVFFNDDEVKSIHQMAGTLPFLLQMSAGKWFLAKKRNEQLLNLEEIQRELVDEARPYCENWWRDLEEENRILLGEVAKKESIASNSFQDPAMEDRIRFLKNYGLVIEKEGALHINGLILATCIHR